MKYKLSGALSNRNHQFVVSNMGANVEKPIIAMVCLKATLLQRAGFVTAIIRYPALE